MMMKKTFGGVFAALVVVLFGQTAAAGPLGGTQVSKGEANVTTERQVVERQQNRTNIPTVKTTTIRGDLNAMNEDHFAALGMPKPLAKNVVDFRDDHGGFKSVDDLRQVPGMTDQMFMRFRDQLAIAPASKAKG